jgi:putative SOS response-associated peptidase YedK
MPGRLAIYDDGTFKEDIYKKIGKFDDDIQVLYKRYNIAPTINIPIFTNTKKYTYAHFGLIPSWANDRSNFNINARSETVFEKKSFRESYKQRRCLIPINGYYEWEKDEDTKQSIPYIITSTKENYFAIAGIYEHWFDNEIGKTITSCALLTTQPNKKIEKLHDRMPVILEQKDWKKWLDSQSNYAVLNSLYPPIDDDFVAITQVNDIVNSVKNDTLECTEKSNKQILVQNSLF